MSGQFCTDSCSPMSLAPTCWVPPRASPNPSAQQTIVAASLDPPIQEVAMSNAFKGMVAGLVATLVLSGLMFINSAADLMPQINIIRWLTALGTLSVAAALMD